MTAVRVSPSWLALREHADAVARAPELVDQLRPDLPAAAPLLVHDLACGTGSMLRWLAPQLPGPQHWICSDLDADLLAVAAGQPEQRAADATPVTVSPQQQDVTRLAPGACAGAALITVSALLDLLTADELDRLVATCADAHCPALLTLSVTGCVELDPPHPLDAAVGAAFNAHQRRIRGGRRLLGPDAPDAAARAFRRSGFDVTVRASDWCLGPDSGALAAAWFAGWLAAACAQRPELDRDAREYARWRRDDAASGQLRVRVHHRDLLARPKPDRGVR
jgi:SAM-dependent methyltransferase